MKRQGNYPNIKEKVKGVILFGDSVFFGIGASHWNKGCARILKKRLKGTPVFVKARNFDSTREGKIKLETEVSTKGGFSHIVIFFGNNDCRLVAVNTPRVDLDEFKSNLKYMIKTVRGVNLQVILSNLQPIDSKLFYRTLPDQKAFIRMEETPYLWHKRYSEACREVAMQEGVCLVDIHSVLKEQKEKILASDGLHPNDEGHMIIADKIFEALMGS